MIARWRLSQPTWPKATPTWRHLFRRAGETRRSLQAEGEARHERRSKGEARTRRARAIRIDAERHFFGLHAR